MKLCFIAAFFCINCKKTGKSSRQIRAVQKNVLSFFDSNKKGGMRDE